MISRGLSFLTNWLSFLFSFKSYNFPSFPIMAQSFNYTYFTLYYLQITFHLKFLVLIVPSAWNFLPSPSSCGILTFSTISNVFLILFKKPSYLSSHSSFWISDEFFCCQSPSTFTALNCKTSQFPSFMSYLYVQKTVSLPKTESKTPLVGQWNQHSEFRHPLMWQSERDLL